MPAANANEEFDRTPSDRSITPTNRPCYNYPGAMMYQMNYGQELLYEVCFDERQREPVWSRHVLKYGFKAKRKDYSFTSQGLLYSGYNKAYEVIFKAVKNSFVKLVAKILYIH